MRRPRSRLAGILALIRNSFPPDGWIRALLRLFMVGAVLLAYLIDSGPAALRVALAVGLLLATGFVFRRSWQQMFGPVFSYELIRTSRRGRYFVMRCGYAAFLLAAFLMFYGKHAGGLVNVFEPQTMLLSQAAQFANGLFEAFLFAEFAAILLLAPLFAAGALTEEKERRTLEDLLTTELEDGDIVLGKLGARLLQLGLVVFTGLPIVSLVQFMGGVDPELVLASFVAAAVTGFSSASIGIAVSAAKDRTSSAVGSAYYFIGGYYLFTLVPGFCCGHNVSFLNFGNPLVAWVFWSKDHLTSQVLLGYCSTQLVLAIGCMHFAVSRLRRPERGPMRSPPVADPEPFPVAVPAERDKVEVQSQAESQANLRPSPSKSSGRPALVGDDALWWKEQQPTGGARYLFLGVILVSAVSLCPTLLFGQILLGLGDSLPERHSGLWLIESFVRVLGPALAGAMVLLIAVGAVADHAAWWSEQQPTRMPRALASALVLLFMGLLIGVFVMPDPDRRSLEGLSAFFRVLGTGLACAMFLMIAVTSAGRVSLEWEKQTLQGLLLLPIDRSQILDVKWQASVLHPRGLWWALGWLWLMASLTGGPTFWALPVVIAWWWAYAAFVAATGIWFSVLTRSTVRATLWTPLGCLAAAAAGWIAIEWSVELFRNELPPRLVVAFETLQAHTFSPPMALWTLSSPNSAWDEFLAAAAGILFYLAATALMWKMTRQRFQIMIHEVPS